jgi:uncharacterized membrane protein
MSGLKTRFLNPVFLLAFASFVYQVLGYFHVQIDQGTFKGIVDFVTYVLLGTGVYHTFGLENKQ